MIANVILIRRPASAVAPPTLWVDDSAGNDANTLAQVRAGNGAVAWKTIGRAAWGSTTRGSPNTAECAQPGDIVQVANATYALSGSGLTVTGWGGPTSRLSPLYTPALSGTSAGNPITFRKAPGATVTLETTQSSATSGPVIGSVSKDYIAWDGFRIVGANAWNTSDTGHVTVNLATGIDLRNLVIVGDGSRDYSSEGNYNGIRFEDCDECRAYNCDIAEVYQTVSGTPQYGGNQDGIGTYDARALTIEHCTIKNCGQGVYIKGEHGVTEGQEQLDILIRFCKVFDCGETCIGVYAAHRVRVAQNVCYQVVRGYRGINVFGGPVHNGSNAVPEDYDIENNVLDGFAGYGICFEDSQANTADWVNVKARSNILLNCRAAFGAPNDIQSFGDYRAQHNTYHNCAGLGSSRISLWAESGSQVYYTFPQWQAQTIGGVNQDSTAPAGDETDPLFVDEANHDYHLQVGSTMRNAGRTIASNATVHRGAYATDADMSTLTIGVE